MGKCAANGPVKWESCCWLVLKVSRYSCRLFLTNRSFRFLVRLKAFGSGLLKILLVVLSSRRIRKFVEMILPASRFMGWKVLNAGTLSLALLLAASIFKISALDLVDACSFPLLIGSFG